MYDNYSTHAAICPYCNHENKASDSDGLLYKEAVDEWECEDCGKTFLVAAYVKWSWTTAPLHSTQQAKGE